MQQSLDEHAAFHEGIEIFTAYLQSFTAGKEQSFKEKTLVELINAFATPLLHHSHAEIVTILALERFPEAEIQIIYQSTHDEAVKKMNAASLVTHFPIMAMRRGTGGKLA